MQMVCDGCRFSGPFLCGGGGLGAVRELRRCRRCEGIVDVPVAIQDLGVETAWRRQSRRGRCQNVIDADGTTCRSQALAPIPGFDPDEEISAAGLLEGEVDDEADDEAGVGYGDLTQPCHACGGVMRSHVVGLWD